MRMTFKGAKILINIFAVIVLFLFVFIILTPTNNPGRSSTSLSTIPKISPFSLKDNDISYIAKVDSNIPKGKDKDASKSDDLKIESLNKAKAMTEVKWTPKRNMVDKSCSYTFIKGKEYQGVPYSMDPYQVKSPSDFLNKINNSKGLYGNDCSGLVSAAWGIKRQTTLTLYDEVKSKKGKKFVSQISWDDLKPADALLLDNGRGKGHIMLYIDSDKKNSDNLNVYEQNIPTVTPYEPIPVARKDVRSKSKLMKKGYIPIRLTAM